jgi:hypothetical protein
VKRVGRVTHPTRYFFFLMSGPDSDGSDSRIAKKVAQDSQQTQLAVRGTAEVQVEASGGPSASGGPAAVGGPSANRSPASVGGPSTGGAPSAGSASILERPRAAAYSQTQRVQPKTQTKIARKEPAPPAVIRMMIGRPEFDFVSSLRDATVTGMTWGDLFVLAPRVKRDVARQLVQERVRKSNARGKGKTQKSVSFVEDAIEECYHVEAAYPTAMGRGRALAEDPAVVTNFYTTGKINQVSRQEVTVYSIGKILVDSGSVLNLMPEYLARYLNLRLSPTKSLMMRTAAAEVSIIQWYVDLDIEIAGVTATSRVYCIPAPARPSYTLLLGRKWMKQVRAIGNYDKGTYVIHDSLGTKRIVTAQAAPMSIKSEVPVLTIAEEDEVDDELDEETRLELALGPDGYTDALLRQVEEEAEEEMQTQGGAADEDGYAGDSEESGEDIYVDETVSGNVRRR